jgi:hypothetical protein
VDKKDEKKKNVVSVDVVKLMTQTLNNFSGFFSPDRDRVMDML